MDAFGTIEAVKAVSDLYCPVKAEVLEINASLDDEPAVVNSDPYGEGWMIKIRVQAPDQMGELMDAAAYTDHVGG
jgi:glycine cleavage system H protein